MHYSRSTEDIYVYWCRTFIRFWPAKPMDVRSNCATFGRKAQVANKGWCTAWVKAPG